MSRCEAILEYPAHINIKRKTFSEYAHDSDPAGVYIQDQSIQALDMR